MTGGTQTRPSRGLSVPASWLHRSHTHPAGDLWELSRWGDSVDGPHHDDGVLDLREPEGVRLAKSRCEVAVSRTTGWQDQRRRPPWQVARIELIGSWFTNAWGLPRRTFRRIDELPKRPTASGFLRERAIESLLNGEDLFPRASRTRRRNCRFDCGHQAMPHLPRRSQRRSLVAFSVWFFGAMKIVQLQCNADDARWPIGTSCPIRT